MTPGGFRALAVAALTSHVPLVGGRVHAGRTWPIPGRGALNVPLMPALLVDVPRIRRTTLSRGATTPTFRSIVTLTVVVRSERGTDADVSAELDAVSDQVLAAILQLGDFREIPEEWTEVETIRDVSMQGEMTVGQDAHAFDAQFTELREVLQAPDLTVPPRLAPFGSARLSLDAIEPFDPAGAHEGLAGFPPPAAPPRDAGPDGRAEADVSIIIPQS